MKRPEPKQELKVVIASSTGVLHIWCATHDAVQWVEKEAPVYGNLYPPTFEGHHLLFVSDLYDFNEVAEYLQKGYGNEQKSS